MTHEHLRTVKQLAEANPGVWTEASLRWLIYNARQNGLEKALLKVGRRVLIDVPEFERWLEGQRMSDGRPGGGSQRVA